jgi:hypothetical protein
MVSRHELVSTRVADPDWFADVVVAASPQALLESRWRVSAANPGCAFILHINGDVAMSSTMTRAIREADLVVARSVDAVRTVPLRPAVVGLPANDAQSWLAVVERALAARSAANRLAVRQLAFHTVAASPLRFSPHEVDDAARR